MADKNPSSEHIIAHTQEITCSKEDWFSIGLRKTLFRKNPTLVYSFSVNFSIASFHRLFKFGLMNAALQLQSRKNEILPVFDRQVSRGTSISDSEKIFGFAEICDLASREEEYFRTFRRCESVRKVIEGITIDQGFQYAERVIESPFWRDTLIGALKLVDSFGAPTRFIFPGIGRFSSTSLRYLKVYLDLQEMFGPLTEMRISEIGIGFGGQAALINALDRPTIYSCFDIPPVLSLAQRFLGELKLSTNCSWNDGRTPIYVETDLLISNYAFSELERKLQERYLEAIVLKAPKGYLTWNRLSQDQLGGFSVGELIRLIPNSEIVPEIPLTNNHNLIIVWGHKVLARETL